MLGIRAVLRQAPLFVNAKRSFFFLSLMETRWGCHFRGMHMNRRWRNYTRFFFSVEYQQGMRVRECELTNVCRKKYFWNCKLQMVFSREVLMPNGVLEFWVTHQCTEIYFWSTRQLSVEYAIKHCTLESGSEEDLHLQWRQVKVDSVLALVFFVAADWFKSGKLN